MQAVTLKTVSNWNEKIDVMLPSAMFAAIEIVGKDGKQACAWAMALMAKSASALTKQAKKNRKVMKGLTENGRKYKYVDVIVKSNGETRRFPQFNARPYNPDAKWSWDNVKLVPSRGLAKRSWFWSLNRLRKSVNKGAYSKPINGATELIERVSANLCGLAMFNRIGYIFKAAPADVEQRAARAASNQIMAQVAKKIEANFGIRMNRLNKHPGLVAFTNLEREWKKNGGGTNG
jgi:hypothetical protein